MSEVSLYPALLSDIKARIRQGQLAATRAVNNELTALYWDVGRLIHERQQLKGWGAGIIPKLSRDLANELPDTKGFSERNLKRMLRFYREYAIAKDNESSRTSPLEFVPQAVALLPWGHNAVLFEQVKDLPTRLWYARQVSEQGWSRATLLQMIRSGAHVRQGSAVSNFEQRLPAGQSELAQQQLKDPYIFDFLTIAEPFRERELETGLLRHLEAFLLELGDGFAFVGRQYPVTVSDQEYYIDLLFYHLTLRAFIVIELLCARAHKSSSVVSI